MTPDQAEPVPGSETDAFADTEDVPADACAPAVWLAGCLAAPARPPR